MKDEELRLECLRMAFATHGYIFGVGDAVCTHNYNIPNNITKLAAEYFEFLKTGKPVEKPQ